LLASSSSSSSSSSAPPSSAKEEPSVLKSSGGGGVGGRGGGRGSGQAPTLRELQTRLEAQMAQEENTLVRLDYMCSYLCSYQYTYNIPVLYQYIFNITGAVGGRQHCISLHLPAKLNIPHHAYHPAGAVHTGDQKKKSEKSKKQS
jgi:hypothetical protein